MCCIYSQFNVVANKYNTFILRQLYAIVRIITYNVQMINIKILDDDVHSQSQIYLYFCYQ